MKNTNKKLSILVGAFFAVSSSYGAFIDSEVPSELYITIDQHDWAWAAPCSPFEPSCGVIDLSYQSQFGWGVANEDDFLRDGPLASSFGSVDDFKCASSYFNNTHQHCDYSDGVDGYVFNMPDGQPLGDVHETWVVRPSEVPVPAAAWLFGSALAGLGVVRRKK